MAIIVNLDVVLAQRKMKVKDLAEEINLSVVNLSILKQSKGKAIRFTTLEAICKALDCQPGDILEYVPGTDEEEINPYKHPLHLTA